MADLNNNIDWGEIYEDTWWGVGVTSNTIGWGIVYLPYASQDGWAYQDSYWQDEIDVWNQI